MCYFIYTFLSGKRGERGAKVFVEKPPLQPRQHVEKITVR